MLVVLFEQFYEIIYHLFNLQVLKIDKLKLIELCSAFEPEFSNERRETNSHAHISLCSLLYIVFPLLLILWQWLVREMAYDCILQHGGHRLDSPSPNPCNAVLKNK